MRYRFLGAVVAVALLFSHGALAEQEDPNTLLQEAIVRYKLGEYEKTLVALEKVLQAKVPPQTTKKALLYRGLTQALFGKSDEATLSFKAALRLDALLRLPKSGVKDTVRVIFKAAKSALAPKIRITTDPIATVLLDGKAVGKTPWEGKVPVGKHQLFLKSVDHLYQLEHAFIAQPEKDQNLALKLEAFAALVTVSTKPSGALLRVGGKTLGRSPIEDYLLPAGQSSLLIELEGYQPQAKSLNLKPLEKRTVFVTLKKVRGYSLVKEERKAKPRLWTWVALGTAAAVAAVGLGLGVSAEQSLDEYNAAAEAGHIDEYYEAQATYDRRALAANISFITAGAFAVTAVVLFFVEGNRYETVGKKARLRLSPAFGGGVLGGTF
jgi:tetratricopeptide (TPR) repeat protein